MEEIKPTTRIKEIMQEKGVSLVSLSEATGIEKGNLSALVNDKRNPTLRTLMGIAKALGVNITELFEKPAERPQVEYVCPCCGKRLHVEVSLTEEQA